LAQETFGSSSWSAKCRLTPFLAAKRAYQQKVMGRCVKGTSQGILLVVNTLIFIAAVGALSVSIWAFSSVLVKSLTKTSLLAVIVAISTVLIFFSVLGCRTALTPPTKKCSKCVYLTILFVLFLAEWAAAGYVYNVGNALQVAKDNHVDVKQGVDKAAAEALHFLHDQLQNMYTQEDCHGGAATSKISPFNFSTVSCKTEAVTEAFSTLFKDNTVTNADRVKYANCTTDLAFTKASSTPSPFTQSFCGSETHIASLAHKYAKYLLWFPVALAGLTFILLVSTICLIAEKNQRRVRLQHGQRGLHGSSQLGQRGIH